MTTWKGIERILDAGISLGLLAVAIGLWSGWNWSRVLYAAIVGFIYVFNLPRIVGEVRSGYIPLDLIIVGVVFGAPLVVLWRHATGAAQLQRNKRNFPEQGRRK